MTSMFWGLRLEPGKRYSTTVDKSFHVSMAAMDVSSTQDKDYLSVMLQEADSQTPYILCNLCKDKLVQCSLDLNFMTGDKVTFFCKGNGVVHLSGYIVPDENDFEDEFGMEEGDEDEEDQAIEEEDEDDKPQIMQKKRKGDESIELKGKQKKKKVDEPEDMEDMDDGLEDSDDMDDEGGEEGEDDFDYEDDDDDEEGAEESDDEAVPQLVTPVSQKKEKPKQQQTPNQNKQTPAKSPKVNGMTPQSGKKDGKKPNEGPAQKGKEDQGTPGKPRVIEGGVSVRDVRVGNGPVCKSGRLATVYYTGRLKTNNKVFDSTTNGPGFKFRVGRGEVIKGWDVGLEGMKVGGKRIITCPPPMAYGAKGSPPTIPGNSTLLFEVELKGLQ